MKTKRWFMALSAAMAVALVLGGCNWEHDEDDDDHRKKNGSEIPGYQAYYAVDFIVTGGPIPPPDQNVKCGERAAEPVVRDASNAIIPVDWYSDQQFTVPYYFNIPVTNDITLYGKWEDDG
ncbi:MAG: InlB B-repeat-containing protein [Treponema sp.]|nr:InlB B-repeat-containing protein [Treponema sp.]